MILVFMKDGFIEEFPDAKAYTEVLGRTIIWRHTPIPNVTRHSGIIDYISTDLISRIETHKNPILRTYGR